eukprot:GDKJ01018368.1.p1 GENE.GDKJ01018368.1~~GDKJ01018368.1.p1  ORF type:complete len:754 (-),score=137.29 GDKJ01018368.1:123-2267(-)
MYNVSDYLLDRLQELRVRHIFGVPGDFALVFFRRVESNAKLRYIACCNELNASYAADGYARLRGLGVVATTYNVGDLSAVNGIAGAFSESVPVVLISGCPNTEEMKSNAVVHHALFDTFTNMKMYEKITCGQLYVDNARTAPALIDAILIECLQRSKPIFILLPADISAAAVSPPTSPLQYRNEVQPIDSKLISAESELLMTSMFERLRNAERPVLISNLEVARIKRASEVMKKLSMTVNAPVFSTWTGVSSYPSDCSQYRGMYGGSAGSREVSDYVETKSDLVFMFGEHCGDIALYKGLYNNGSKGEHHHHHHHHHHHDKKRTVIALCLDGTIKDVTDPMNHIVLYKYPSMLYTLDILFTLLHTFVDENVATDKNVTSTIHPFPQECPVFNFKREDLQHRHHMRSEHSTASSSEHGPVLGRDGKQEIDLKGIEMCSADSQKQIHREIATSKTHVRIGKDTVTNFADGEKSTLTVEHIFKAIGSFIRNYSDCIVVETGSSMYAGMEFPTKARIVSQGLYESIGYGIPASLGVACAFQADHMDVVDRKWMRSTPEREVGVADMDNVNEEENIGDRFIFCVTGDGASQLSIQELSTIARYHLPVVVCVVNNYGFTIERVMLDSHFNDIQPWNYRLLASGMQLAVGSHIPAFSDASLKAQIRHLLRGCKTERGNIIRGGLIECSVPVDAAPDNLVDMGDAARAKYGFELYGPVIQEE